MGDIGRAVPGGTSAPVTPAARPAAKAEPRRPYHIGVAVGLCAGVYAGSLTAVTVLQIDRDRALIADRAPVGEAIGLLAGHNDRMTKAIEAADTEFRRAADGYDGVSRGAVDLDTAVKRLTARVAAITGSAGKLPDSLRLPTVTSGGGGGASSGGGKASSGGGSSGSGSISLPKPRPAPPPPANATTGASGG
jgi:hypothetical protein